MIGFEFDSVQRRRTFAFWSRMYGYIRVWRFIFYYNAPTGFNRHGK